MSKVSAVLRLTDRGYAHWCPDCGEMHTIFENWSFDGNVDAPTFNPSIKISAKLTIKDARGKWTGEWARDAAGKAIDSCCHYHLWGGMLHFCSDSTHALAGRTVPLPELPE
jgi:hypothetical protein